MPSSPDGIVAARPRATVLGAFLEGWRRVLRAPVLAIGVLVATLLLALPLSVALRGMLEEHLGSSLQAEQALNGWNAGWAAEFGAQAQGLGRTFTHEILGFGGTLANVSRVLDHGSLNPTVAGAAAAYIVLWIFLSGGVLDRLARARTVRTAAFFGACGVFFWRFLRLAVGVGLAYWWIFRYLHPFLFGTLYDQLTRDLTTERTVFLIRGGLYAVLLAVLMLVSVIADFAKVRAVVEDRRSMLGAFAASMRFIRRRSLRVAALYFVNTAAFLFILWLWSTIAPRAGAETWWAFLVAEIYLLLRIWARLAFLASDVAFFQAELAHVEYTALPEPLWPESPAAEAIENMTRKG